jgi:O-methyltransferase domain
LRRINFLMGNERWVCRAVRRYAGFAQQGICEIGAGDGQLCGRLARQFPNAAVSAYDLAPRPSDLDPRVSWKQGDIFAAAVPETSGILVANLFLHHFEGAALLALGEWFRNFEILIFCEPDRARLPHFLGWLMHPWINRVTRHDMHVSITAGFGAAEIQQLLGLDPEHWRMQESSTWRGARRVIVSRN